MEDRFRRQENALRIASSAIPAAWRRSRALRSDLDRFLFEPGDIVVAVGQDGLVANVAKYLDHQAVIGLNPDPDANEGILVPHAPEEAGELYSLVAHGEATFEERTMVGASLDDGQELVALNELFIGHRSHQSARYRLSDASHEERQSSSGIIVTTGTGATGWARSIHRNRQRAAELPAPTAASLAYFVREAWPSVATGTKLTDGVIDAGEQLTITSEMGEDGVVFGDGIETDRIEFGWGRRLVVRVAKRRLRLVGAS